MPPGRNSFSKKVASDWMEDKARATPRVCDQLFTQLARLPQTAPARGQERRGHGDKLDRRADAAIVALLANPTMAEAAKAAGVSETTLGAGYNSPISETDTAKPGRRSLKTH